MIQESAAIEQEVVPAARHSANLRNCLQGDTILGTIWQTLGTAIISALQVSITRASAPIRSPHMT